jgi:copper chaperone NosL
MRAPDLARVVAVVAVAAAAAACAPAPKPIEYGTDICTHCRMSIVDDRYGAELVTRTGLTHTFDSIECLADYVLRMEDPASVHSLWVTSFQHPGELIAIEDALFLHSEMLRSPMGANLTAFRRDAITPIALVDSFGGVVLSWDEVLDHVRRNGHTHAHDGAIQAGALPASGHDVHSRHAGVEHTVDQAGPP